MPTALIRSLTKFWISFGVGVAVGRRVRIGLGEVLEALLILLGIRLGVFVTAKATGWPELGESGLG